MATSREADHALGLELQLEELVEQRERARVQGRREDLPAIDREIAQLQQELADTAEAATSSPAGGAVPTIRAEQVGCGGPRWGSAAHATPEMPRR